ncbi:MAG TPA: glycosyltransferase family 2 protein [Candidatus Bathyarchaeia archaeon]
MALQTINRTVQSPKGTKMHLPYDLVLLPALNEEEGIGHTIVELKKWVHNPQILVVDGKSLDRTVHIAKSLGAKAVFQEGVGKGDAVGFGLRHSDSDYRYVVLTDADYTYPAEFIPRMVEILDEQPDVGMVCGNRFNSHLHREAMHDINYIGNRLLAIAQSLFNGVSMRDPLSGLRVIRWEILKDWRPKSDGFDIEVEMNNYVKKRGYRIMEIEIPYRRRLGEKKLKFSHGFRILKRIISEKYGTLN